MFRKKINHTFREKPMKKVSKTGKDQWGHGVSKIMYPRPAPRVHYF